MKVLQITVGGHKLFGRSLKLLANVQCTLTRKEGVYKVCNRYQLANHLACKAGVFCCAIDLDFRLTKSWGESKNDSIQ